MWPSDQRLEGGMMTYRGRGHTQVKDGLLSNTNTEKNPTTQQHGKTTAMTEQLHSNRERQQHSKTKQNHGNNMAAKSLPRQQRGTAALPQYSKTKARVGHVTPHLYSNSSVATRLPERWMWHGNCTESHSAQAA